MSEQRLINANTILEHKEVCELDDGQSFEYIGTDTIDDAPTVLTIPDNPTNGDVIKAVLDITNMWTGYYVPAKQNQVHIKMAGSEDVTSFDADWWNAPWKRGNGDE